jgi:hypothetical protein
MTFTDAELLDLAPGLGQRRDGFGFVLLNSDRTPAGSLSVSKSSSPSVQVSTSRTSMRTMSGLIVVDPPDLQQLAALRLQPVHILQNGTVKRLGVLMFGQDQRQPTNPRTPWVPQLYDETFLLDQKLDASWSLPQGGSVLATFTAMAGEILDPLGVPHVYDVPDVAADSNLLWPVGSSRNDALVSQAKLLGALPHFFDNDGVHRLQMPPTIDLDPEHFYDSGGRIVKDSVTITSNLFSAPNRYIVTGDNISGAPVAGYYDLPPSAPHSAASNGGQIISTTQAVPGVTDPELAAQIAYVNAITDRTTYGTATFDSPTDSRHDIFDTVHLLGITYLETGWTLTCKEGGAMSHQLTRIYG